MQQWYRSGIEGYCKAAAQMMGLPDNNSGWGNFGRDLFADGRFDDPAKASKTWTLSRFRTQGRSNRPKLFEDSWLGKHGTDCDFEAIHACVHAMCSTTGDSALHDLYLGSPETFPIDFHRIVLPALADGFAAERYHPADIAQFSQSIDKALEKLDPSLPQTFRTFAIPLVAGVIYGPGHVMARSTANTATIHASRERADGEPTCAVDYETIILTQIFEDDAGLVGNSIAYGDDRVILLGRSPDVARYVDACDDELSRVIERAEPVPFPVSHTHVSTSNAHGVIARIGGIWYFHDFSSNGSYVHNAHQPSAVHHGAVALAPGDRIYLGLTELPENDSSAYLEATTVLVSFKLDEANLDNTH